MSAFHLIKEECVVKCQYCGKDLSPSRWSSLHFEEKHYKTAKCSCGKTLRLLVRFEGSGHDNWAEKQFAGEGLENRVMEIKQAKNK